MCNVLMRSARWWTVAAAFAVAVAASADTPRATHAALAVSGRSNATPTIAALNRFVAVTWGATLPKGAADVYAAVSRDGGRTFAAPVRVNDVPGNASLSGEQPPHVTLVPRANSDPEVLVVWTAKAKDGTRLLTARSTDAGASFGPAKPIGASEAGGNRGWESSAVDPNGHVVAVWLDHRELAASTEMAAMKHVGHDHAAATNPSAPKADGAIRAQLSKLYFARVDDPASAQVVAGGVCYCCKTAVVAAPDGSIYAAWRHVYPGNVRDIAFTASHDAGRTFAAPIRVSDDRWAIDGCPENGPALAVGAHGIVHVVWPTLVSGPTGTSDPALALFYAATTTGRQFSARQRLPTQGTPRHPQVVAKADGSLVIAWDEEGEAGHRRVVAVSATSNGPMLRFVPLTIENQQRAEYPVVAVARDATVIAWTSGEADKSAIRVEQIP